MLGSMGTVVSLVTHWLHRAGRFAAESRRVLPATLEHALRSVRRRRKDAPPNRLPFRMPTFKGNGVRPGVNLDSNAELLDIMEGRQPPQA